MATMDPINGTYESRTGTVFVRHFDEAIKEYLGALNETTNAYEMAVDGLENNEVVHLVSAQPEQPKLVELLPALVIRRSSVSVALQRMTFITTEYRIPSPGASPLSVTTDTGTVLTGYSSYEQKQQAWPFDINYDLEFSARYMEDAILILDCVLRKFPPLTWIPVADSQNETRKYLAVQEGVEDISELVDMTMRIRGFSVAVRVEGELDLKDPIISQAVRSRILTLQPIDPNE